MHASKRNFQHLFPLGSPKYLTVILLILSNYSYGQNQQTYDNDRFREVEQVTVVGHRPGPRLWKISKNDTTSWIFAYISPAPSDLKWDSTFVEEILDEVDHYIPEVKTTVPYTIHKDLRNIEDKKKLVEILPGNTLDKYLEIQSKYFNILSIKKRRPFLAQRLIQSYMLNDFKLGNPRKVLKKIDSLVRKYDVPTINIDNSPSDELRNKVGDSVNSKISNLEFDEEIRCFNYMLDNIEYDFGLMRNMGVAWANGYVDELSYYYDEISLRENSGCNLSLKEFAVYEDLDKLADNANTKIISALDTAHSNNESVFLVMNINKLVFDNPFIYLLEDSGFVVTSPLE